MPHGEACQATVASRNMTTRRTMTTTTSFFYITTNLVVRCIPGREGGVILKKTTKKMRMPGKRGQGHCGRMRDEG